MAYNEKLDAMNSSMAANADWYHPDYRILRYFHEERLPSKQPTLCRKIFPLNRSN